MLFAVGGLALAVLVVQLFVVRLNVAVPGIVTVNKFIAGTSYSPAELLKLYWSTAIDLLGRTLRDHGLLLVAAVATVIARTRRLRIGAGVLALTALVLSVRQVVVHDGALGGSTHVYAYPGTLLAAVLVAVVVAATVLIAGRVGGTDHSRWDRKGLRGWVVLALLLILPMVVAFGSNNPLFVIGLGTFAAWVAVMIAVVTAIPSVPVVARVTVGVVSIASLVVVASIAHTGLFSYPYRSFEHSQLTAPAPTAPLKGLYLQPATARNYAELQRRLKPYLQPAGRPILAFDKMAGLVLILGGKPLGEAWIAPAERARTAAGIEEVCRKGRPERAPLIILNRQISDSEISALQSCGLNFHADYEQLAPTRQTIGLQVWVPKAERGARSRG